MFTLIRDFNRTLAEPLAQATPSAVLGANALVELIEQDIGGILGIGRSDATHALEDLTRIRLARPQASGTAPRPAEDEINALVQARIDARKSKDFAKADEIRKDLESRGILIKDSPTGTTWEYK